MRELLLFAEKYMGAQSDQAAINVPSEQLVIQASKRASFSIIDTRLLA
jgi:hypothetical protein